jgi:AraC-like DNA-binding protein/mannose-6-phosphate isomerase-like protein (cupin superfamily)
MVHERQISEYFCYQMAEVPYSLTEMSKMGGGDSPDVRAGLAKQFRALSDPRDFWAGRIFPAPLVPQNILVFPRASRRELFLGDASRSQHHRFVLITAVEGDGEMGIDTQKHRLGEGESLLVHPFQAHWYERSGRKSPLRWVFVTFEHEPDERLDVLRDVGALGGGENARLLHGFLRAWQDAASRDLVPLRLAEWLHFLGRTARRKRRVGARSVAPPSEEGIVTEVNRFVFEHRQSPVSLDQVAKRLGMSPSLLRMRFRASAGLSVGKYIRELKLQYSCELLHGTRLAVGEIASRCGYDTVFSYSRAFRRTYGMAPTAYRAKAQSRTLGKRAETPPAPLESSERTARLR